MERPTSLEQGWSARLLRARELGQTPKEIALEHGVAESTVYAWRRRIEGPVRRAAQHAPTTSEDVSNNEVSLPRFAKLERVPSIAVASASGGVVLEVARVRLTVKDTAGIPLAMQVVQALREIE